MVGYVKRYLSPRALHFHLNNLVNARLRDMLFMHGSWFFSQWLLRRGRRAVPFSLEGAQSLPISALFTTTTGLFLLAEGHNFKLLSGRFTGLTRCGDRYYAVEELFQTKRCRVFSFYLQGDKVSDMCEVYSMTYSGGLHQLDFVGDLLYLADTHNNNVTVLDAEGRVECKIYPNRIHTRNRPNTETDSRYYCHFNSVFGGNGKIFVLANNETSKTGVASRIYAINEKDYGEIEVLDTVDCGANSHNIVLHDGRFYICDSLDGGLLCDGETVLKTPHFTRGLAMDDEFIAVGCSQRAERHRREETNAYIYVLNRRFEQVCQIALGALGQVYDIRLLGLDYGLSNSGRECGDS